MKIHAISTGLVRVTKNWREGKGTGLMRLANTLLDREFTAWLPIMVWVIEHPEGLIVIDTGIPVNANDPVYFPPHMRLVQRAAPFRIAADEEIDVQMRARGLDPRDVRRVILTHLHQDHDGGLHHFPNAEFIVSRAEWNAAQGFGGRMGGYLNQRWFKGFSPRTINFKDGTYESFAASERITPAGDIRLVPTPGHSAGHLSVVVEDGDQIIFIVGDAAYTQDGLLRDVIDGIGPDPQAQHDTHQRILDLAARIPTVFLPSHDPDAAERLSRREALPILAERKALFI